ncbi:hypothetical protein QFZ30_001102 [Arthrobacter pascens]|nr:hypothetical protein [Arthrobacter pascens]
MSRWVPRPTSRKHSKSSPHDGGGHLRRCPAVVVFPVLARQADTGVNGTGPGPGYMVS